MFEFFFKDCPCLCVCVRVHIGAHECIHVYVCVSVHESVPVYCMPFLVTDIVRSTTISYRHVVDLTVDSLTK